MSDTVNNTETATQGNSKTTDNTTTAPVQGNAVDPAEVERLRKEAEQARMRAQQLENELKAKREAEEAAKAKQLEEQNEYKQLYEQSQAKIQEFESNQQREQRERELNSGTDEVLSTFSQEVVEIAKEAGLSLADTTDEAKAALKEKLEKIQAKVVKDAKSSPNNPNTSTATATGEQLIEQMRYGNNQQRQQARHQAIGSLEAVQQMKRMAGLSE